jgi:hypothetical protein
VVTSKTHDHFHIVKALHSYTSKVESATFCHYMQTADYRNTFSRLKNLKMLHLRGVNCDFTRAFTNTQLLHLTEFRFTDSPMLMMEAQVISLPSALPNVECIDFSGSQITNKLLRVLLSGLKKV